LKAVVWVRSVSGKRNGKTGVPYVDDFTAPAGVADLPKADLHVHAESDARLDRVLAAREGRDPFDWQAWRTKLVEDVPPGMGRLKRLGAKGGRAFPPHFVDALDAQPELFIGRVVDLLTEAAGDGAVLVEVTFGAATILIPDFMALFREAEQRVQGMFPLLRAEALIAASSPASQRWIDELLPACIAAAREGLAGIHIIPEPYDIEADWVPIYRWARDAVKAGLGLAAHAGEFSSANLRAALNIPGITRIGHAVYASSDPEMLEQLLRSGVTVECSLTCNVVLGATESYESHPIRTLVSAGIPVTINTDNPIRTGTTIGQEYAIASELGLTNDELVGCTLNAIRASFAPPERRAEIARALIPSTAAHA
jgi:adenosine deaminase